MYGTFTVQVDEGGGKWKQLRSFDADYMGLSKARDAAVTLAKGCASHAVVEQYGPAATDCGCLVYDNRKPT